MKFGKVQDPSQINFTMPDDHPRTREVLAQNTAGLQTISVGHANLSKSELIGFYPRGTKDELTYYATEFNALEFNSTFYRIPTPEQVEKWRKKTGTHFKFFPKVPSTISHYKRLLNTDDLVTQFAETVLHFEEKLGMTFLQLHENYGPSEYGKLVQFIQKWPQEIPLTVEIRNRIWNADADLLEQTFALFENHNITSTILDSAGRRDLLQMHMTTPSAFIRFVATNSEYDYPRLQDWIKRLTEWKAAGLQNLYFFMHQSFEHEMPMLSTYFIEELNKAWGTELKIPRVAREKMNTLF